MRDRARRRTLEYMSTITVNGVSLYYEEYGYEEHGSGEPILCIHGTGSSSALWVDAAAELANHGRAIVYDRRGFGRSERPEPYVTNVHQHTDDAAALIDALDAAPAIVIGRSHGGEVAVDLALRHPERVRALALLEGGGFSLSEAFMRWDADLTKDVLAAAEVDVSTAAETMFRRVLGDAGWGALPEQVKRVFTANSPAIVAELRGGPLDIRAADLATIVQPTLLVAGKDSPRALTEVTNLAAAAIPSARIEWVEGGHLINPAHPVVLDFVDEVLASRGLRPTAPRHHG
jgi:esterase